MIQRNSAIVYIKLTKRPLPSRSHLFLDQIEITAIQLFRQSEIGYFNYIVLEHQNIPSGKVTMNDLKMSNGCSRSFLYT